MKKSSEVLKGGKPTFSKNGKRKKGRLETITQKKTQQKSKKMTKEVGGGGVAIFGVEKWKERQNGTGWGVPGDPKFATWAKAKGRSPGGTPPKNQSKYINQPLKYDHKKKKKHTKKKKTIMPGTQVGESTCKKSFGKNQTKPIRDVSHKKKLYKKNFNDSDAPGGNSNHAEHTKNPRD